MSTFLSILPIIIALVLYFTGIPIAYALFAAALTYFGFIDTTTMPYLLMQKFVTATQSFPFLAIPFFIMCGSIMNYGGISARLMDFADALTGHLPGGLAQINVLLSMLMGGCSGSANADAAMECKLLVPEMEKRGYGKGFSAAITAASSCVTPIIPPGINLIVYGLIAGASVGQLFAAGYVPGLLMAVALMIAVAIISKKRGYAPSRPRRATLGEIGRQALKSFWALFFPLGIIMGMRFGIVCNVNIMIGGLTPPFGSMMFTCVSITGCKMQEFIKECVPFIIALLIALLLLTYIPGISMLIPNLIY